MQPQLLLLAAHASELAPAVNGLALADQGGYWQHPTGRLVAAAVGIGPVAAAVGACRWLTRFQPRQVLLLGTAGVYPGCGLALGQAVQVAEAMQLDGACELGLARYPLLGAEEAVQAQAWPGEIPPVRVGCLIGLTLDADLAQRIGHRRQLQLENMEAYAVGKAAQAFGASWSAVLGISNQVGPQGHEQWKQHRHQAQEAAFAAAFPQIKLLLSP